MLILKSRKRLAATALLLGALGMSHAQAADKILLGSVGTGSALNWPVYIGIQKGFAKDADLEIEITSAPSSAAVAQQIAAGAVNIGEGGLADPIRAIDKGAPAIILRVQANAAPYALLSKPSLKTYADLKGKVLSLGGLKDITRIYLERQLIANGIKPGEYDMIFAGATSARYAALEAGSADAAILTSPFNFKAEGNGFNMLGITPDYVKDFPFSGYAVNTAWAKDHKDIVKRFMTMISRSIEWFNDEANKQEGVAILVKGAKAQPEDAEKTWTFYHKIKIYDVDGSPDKAGLGNLLKIMKDLGDIEGNTDVSRFYDASLIGK